MKIHPLETEMKDSEISDDFRSKNSSENRYGAKQQKQEKLDCNPPVWERDDKISDDFRSKFLDLTFPRRSIIQKLTRNKVIN